MRIPEGELQPREALMIRMIKCRTKQGRDLWSIMERGPDDVEENALLFTLLEEGNFTSREKFLVDRLEFATNARNTTIQILNWKHEVYNKQRVTQGSPARVG